MNNMSFKQFVKPVSYGGFTAPRAVGPHELDLWNKVLKMPDIGAKLAGKGSPTSVKSQVVSGVNYIFGFADGSTVTVHHKSWTNKIQVIQ